MAIKMQKPDLYTVLTRRGRTVESFLEKGNIRNIEQLNDFIDTSNGFQYEYSQKFFDKAYEYFAKLNKQRQQKQDEQQRQMEEVASRKAATNKIDHKSSGDDDETQEEAVSKTVVKRKKKSKRTSKSSTDTSGSM